MTVDPPPLIVTDFVKKLISKIPQKHGLDKLSDYLETKFIPFLSNYEHQTDSYTALTRLFTGIPSHSILSNGYSKYDNTKYFNTVQYRFCY